MFTDIKNADIMLANRDFKSLEREVESSWNGSIGPYDGHTNSIQSQRERSPQENEIRGFARNAVLEFANIQTSSENINLLSEEVNYRVSRDIDGVMDSVSTQVNRAVTVAINVQILPQIKNMIRELKESTQGPSRSDGTEPRPEERIPLNSVSSSKNDL